MMNKDDRLMLIEKENNERMKFSKRARSKIMRLYWRFLDRITAKYRSRKYCDFNYTVISNNCWGGTVYEYCCKEKMSPTVGCYFFAEDYLKFVKNLDYYLSIEIEMISHEESKWKDILAIKNEQYVPIGRLDDIEVIFLHYHTDDQAKDKWIRRVKKVDFDRLIVKFSEMNLCTYDHLIEFDNLNFDRKVLFVKKKYPQLSDAFVIPFYSHSTSILDDIPEWRIIRKKIFRHLDI